MGNIFKKLFIRKKSKAELIGELVIIELSRDRNFRRQVGRTALGIRILKIAQK